LERKGCKRVATTTEAEIEEKRLQLNAERTKKQNKAAAAILKDYLFQKKMDIEFEEFDQSPFRKNATQKTNHV
jgi:hypothetical protein